MKKIRGRNKWELYLALKKAKQVRPYLVFTKRWNRNNFQSMLSKYKQIVIKPNDGLQARNIYFVTKSKKKIVVQVYRKKRYFSTSDLVYEFMGKRIGKRPYIIQKRINLAKIHKRPFDVRVIIQRKTFRSPWVATAYKVRVAGAGRKVTNASKGGSVFTFIEAMQGSSFPDYMHEDLLRKLKQVSIRSAESLNSYYPKKRIYGIDIGVKEDGSLHIFEINRNPSFKGFSPRQSRRMKRFKQKK
ncbi:YheC/YheD family protein [Bacillus sp. FJAT-44742]|uniref:YheC/YheD family protein n=1 Tax=Bacillus sp. FJAT-44742 TaxID=2014005 RepID=UPI000C24D30C|nr:YheC/YheD family protein [Bacillus sp. FJAT-44742]